MSHQVTIGYGDRIALYSSVQSDIVMMILRPHQRAHYKSIDKAEQDEMSRNPGGYYSAPVHNNDWVPSEAVKAASLDLPTNVQDLLQRMGQTKLAREHVQEDFDKAIEFIQKAVSLEEGIYSS